MDDISLIVPLFAFTIVTEVPLIFLLFRSAGVSFSRAILLGLGLNAASYIATIMLEIGLLYGWIAYTQYLDKRDITHWQNPQLLEQSAGLIYAGIYSGTSAGLQVYDPRSAQWTALTNYPAADLTHWDVENDLCGFIKAGDEPSASNSVVVARIPEFLPLIEIGSDRFTDPSYGLPSGFSEVAVSPDGSKVAVLARYGMVAAQRDSSSYYVLGSRCQMVVFDIASGKVATRAARWTSPPGLCWLPGSQQILFSSFDDERLYDTTQDSVQGNRGYGADFDRKRFKKSLYLLDTSDGRVRRFADGGAPILANNSGIILVQDDSGLVLLDKSGSLIKRITDLKPACRTACISPDGAMIAADIMRHNPLAFIFGRLAVFSVSDSATRHIILTGGRFGRLDWSARTPRMTEFLRQQSISAQASE